MRLGRPAALVGLAVCIPCLLPVLLAAGIGAGAFAAFGAWFSDNGLLLGGGAGATLAVLGALGWTVRARRAAAAACSDE